MQKDKKIIQIMIVFVIIFSIVLLPNVVKASVSDEMNITISTTEAESNISPIEDVVGTILGFLQVLSALMSVIVIALTGFRYISDDTPEFKRELKERMLPIIIGMVLIFGAVSITNFILGVTS